MMVSRPQSQCFSCTRYRSPFSDENTAGLEGPFCAAFPGGIPPQVWGNEADHREPVEGDHSLQWQSNGQDFPDWLFE